MQINSDFVGTTLDTQTHRVSFRDIVNYAASIDDMNPVYHDDQLAEKLVAPPVFPVVLTWPMVTSVAERLGDRVPPEALARMVHSTEHIEWHSPLKPGDKLRIDGRVEAVVPRYAGTMIVIRFDAGILDGDRRVFTEFTGGLFRGVGCADGGMGQENLPEVYVIEEERVPLWDHSFDVSRRMPYLYDGCTGIEFPIHTSRSFAKSVGLPDIILQGTATLGIAIRELVNHEAGGNPLAVKKLACKFSNVVPSESQIAVQLLARQEGEEGFHLSFQVVNASKKLAVKEGYALVASG